MGNGGENPSSGSIQMFTLNSSKKLILDPDILSAKPFRNIWEWDKSKSKEDAYSILSGLYFLCDYKSPYRDYQESAKNEEIEKMYFTPAKVKITDKLIQDAITFYNEEKRKKYPLLVLLEASNEAIYNLAARLKDKKTASKELISMMKEIENAVKKYSGLKEEIEKGEMNYAQKIGQTKIGNRESD